MVKSSKKLTGKKDFYLQIIEFLKGSTNLSELQEKLSISKQNLNYYLRVLKEKGYLIRKANGYWETTNSVKNLTEYGNILPKDYIRGHAYVWKVYFPKEIKGYDKRIEKLKNSDIHFKLIGVLKDIPRIKVLGRKIWLCKDHIRIFEKKDASFYGDNAIESRKKAFTEALDIVRVIENKLGINLRPLEIAIAKEHYALIKNDLAIDQNKKGIIWRISDEQGEWLLIDDSLEKGGELENTGKEALKTNVPMQKWWNNNKETNFKVTPDFVLNSVSQLTNAVAQSQAQLVETRSQLLEYRKENRGHLKLIQDYRRENVAWRKNEKVKIEKEINNQKKLSEF